MTPTNGLSWSSSPRTRPSGVASSASSTRGRHRRFKRWAESISLIGAVATIVSCGTPSSTEADFIGAASATNQTQPQETVERTAAETTRPAAPVTVSLEPSPEPAIGATTEQLLAARKAYGSAPIFSLLDLGPPPKDLSQLATRSTNFADCVVVRAEAVSGEATLSSVETVMATQAAHVVCQSNATTKGL